MPTKRTLNVSLIITPLGIEVSLPSLTPRRTPVQPSADFALAFHFSDFSPEITRSACDASSLETVSISPSAYSTDEFFQTTSATSLLVSPCATLYNSKVSSANTAYVGLYVAPVVVSSARAKAETDSVQHKMIAKSSVKTFNFFMLSSLLF